MLTEIFIGVSIAIIVGVIIAIASHIANSEKHPMKKDIVFNKSCELRHKGLEDCIEGRITALDDKVDTMHVYMKESFKEVKTLIRNGR